MRLTPHTYRRLAYLASISFQKSARENNANELRILCELDKIYSRLDKLFIDYQDRYIEKTRKRDGSSLPGMSKFLAKLSKEVNLSEIEHIFTTFYDIALFYVEFKPTHQILTIVNAVEQPNVPPSFRDEILLSLLNFCTSPTRSFSPSFLYSLGEFSSLLSRVDLSHISFSFDETDEEKIRFRDAFIEFYHELNKCDQPLAPNAAELRRRKRIQQSHNKRYQDRREKIKKLINEINELANNEKNGMTKKDACSSYFKSNEKYLKKLGITSYRTLQNLCSRVGRCPKQPSIRTRKNSINVNDEIKEPRLLEKLALDS